MKNRVMKSNCSIMYLVIIFIIILIAAFYFKTNRNLEDEKINTEGFTSSLGKIYRPYFRNIRLFKDQVYYKLKNNFYRFVRKFGLN